MGLQSEPDEAMRRHLDPALVRVSAMNGEVFGGGFLIGPRRIITCAHVVNAALGRTEGAQERPEQPVDVDFLFVKGTGPLRAFVHHWVPISDDDSGDLAVLALDEQPDGARPALVRDAQSWLDHPFWALGFPRGKLKGLWASGRLLRPQGDSWVQLEDIKVTGPPVERGFSGTPVWDVKLQAVCGMVVTQDLREEGKTAFMIPVGTLRMLWSELDQLCPDLAPRGLVTITYAETSEAIDRNSDFWVERNAVAELRECMAVPGGFAHVLAPRDVGKTSLLYAAAEVRSGSRSPVVVFDCLAVADGIPDLASLCQEVLSEIAVSLGLDPKRDWDDRRQPMLNFRDSLENILRASDAPLVLALDHIEQLATVPNSSTFFSGLRSCHSLRFRRPVWRQFGLVLVGRVDPLALVETPHKSPFQVGRQIVLDDFTREEVISLNEKHGRPVGSRGMDRFLELTGGHPRIVQSAYNILRRNNAMSIRDLGSALLDVGHPVREMLARGLEDVIEDPGLRRALQQVMDGNGSLRDRDVQRLVLLGWISSGPGGLAARCGLFHEYFAQWLR